MPVLRFAPSPSRRARHLLLSASVAALFIAGIPSAAQAGDITIGPGFLFSHAVYGNSTDVDDPTTFDDTQSSNNALTIDAEGGTFATGTYSSAYGAYANNHGQVSSQNTLTIKNGGQAENAYGAHGFGDVTHNTVTITDSSVGSGNTSTGGDVAGGHSVLADATHNSVTISGSPTTAIITAIVEGGHSLNGTATDNSVIINGGSLLYEVYGARAKTATDNSVEINGGNFHAQIYGGSGAISANKNSLTINGGEFDEYVYGGHVASGTATDNSITINAGRFNENVYGGYSVDGSATDNSITIDDGIFSGLVYGAYSDNGAATGNSITIDTGTFFDVVYGGAGYNGASNNSLTISSGRFDTDISGGFSGIGDVTGNSITISDGIFSGIVLGGVSDSGSATGNSITIDTGSFSNVVYGGVGHNNATGNSITISSGRFDEAILGGLSGSGTVTGNSITISDGIFSGTVCGGSSNGGDATGNSLTINGGSFSEAVYGGYGEDSASYNFVTINTGRFDKDITGGHSASGAASNNTITISEGIFSGTVYGGTSDAGAATGNSITISGGSIGGTIYGGVGSSATNNTVNILGGTLVAGGGTAPSLLGGVHSSGIGDVFTGNALNLHVSGQTAYNVKNFEYLNFYLPTTVADGDIVLKVTDTADLTNGSGKSSVVNVGIDGGSSPLAAGDTITLIRAGTLVTNDDLNDTADGTGMQGVTLEYAFDIAADGNDLTATVAGSKTTESSKALSEGGAVQASVVNQGSDLSSGSGMTNAIGAARSNTTTFSAMSGGSVRTETGSHIDVTGVSLLAGISGTFELLENAVVAAPYLEYGYGAYDTYNTFASGSVHGTGNSSYVGAGVLAHMDLLETEAGHAYVEGGARAGVAYNNFNSADLVSGGVSAQYDASSAYYGLSAGLGYVWNLTEESSLDLYGQYSWNELGSDSVTLSTGETVNFDAIDSHRVRLGARYSYEISDQATPYVDVAWEHEFDGSVSATTNGLAIAEPSLSGDTGILSAGLKLTPSEDLPLTLDLNVTGYVGRNQGVSGGLQAKFAF